MQFTKWGGAAHWHFQMDELGQDAYGAWFMVPPRTSLWRGTEPAITKPDGFVVLVPRVGEWIGAWNHLDDVAIYVDVVTRPRLEGGLVTAVDLDLDVLRWRDGRVEIVDVDEFEHHQVLLDYPPDLVRGAEQTARELAARMRAIDPPFGPAGASWLEKASTLWGSATKGAGPSV